MDRTVSRLWVMRALYVLLALLILFLHLLPLHTVPIRWAPPDVLLAFTLAWTVRRPDYVPILSVAVVALLADLLLQRPPGLMAALIVGGSAYLKAATRGTRDIGLVGEWMTVTIVITAIAVLNRIVLGIAMVQQAPLSLVLMQLALTIAVYPIVVWTSSGLFGVRRPTLATTDAAGGRA